MAATYYAILTAIGEAKLANAGALGKTLQIAKMAVGDGGGATPQPNRDQKKLVNEVRRAPLNQLFVDPANPNQIIAEQVMPEDVGGWWVREMGLYDADGDLVAVCNAPDTYKPLLSSGSGRTQIIRMVLIVSNTAAVELKVDPSIVLAPRSFVEQVMTAHTKDKDPHAQYMTKEEVDPLLSQIMDALGGDQKFAETVAKALAGKAALHGDAEQGFSVGPAKTQDQALQLGQFQTAQMSFKNLLVNGGQRIAQQFGDTQINGVANSTYVTDQWQISGSQSGKVNFQRVAGPKQFGFEYYAQITAPAAVALGANDFFTFYQNVEASMLAPLLWGSANALPVSLQFVVNMPVAGVYSGALINTDGTRSFPFKFTVQKANTDTPITIPGIPGDIAGNWVATGNGIGLKVAFSLGAGSAMRAPAGAWAPGLFWAAAEQTVDLVANAGAAYKITGGQFEVGAVCTAYERPTPDAELARAQRYLPCINTGDSTYAQVGAGFVSAVNQFVVSVPFPVPARTAPTGLLLSSLSHVLVNWGGTGVVPSACAFNIAGYNSARVGFTISGATVGQGGDVYLKAAGGKLLFTGAQL